MRVPGCQHLRLRWAWLPVTRTKCIYDGIFLNCSEVLALGELKWIWFKQLHLYALMCSIGSVSQKSNHIERVWPWSLCLYLTTTIVALWGCHRHSYPVGVDPVHLYQRDLSLDLGDYRQKKWEGCLDCLCRFCFLQSVEPRIYRCLSPNNHCMEIFLWHR